MKSKRANDCNTEQPVGLIGLGLLGSAIAEVLAAAGFTVVGYDREYDKTAAIREIGGWSADSPRHVAEAARRIVLCLPDSAVVRQVIEGPEGILTCSRLPDYIIDTSTGDPDETIALARELEGRKIRLIDATVSGSSQQMRERCATLMVGGETESVSACRDLLDAMSDKVFHLGPCGSGARAKLASNLILGLNRLALAEGLVFAEQLGLDLPTLLDVLKAGPACSAAMDSKGPKMLAGDFAPESRIRQHRKDLALILEHAAHNHQSLPLTQAHADLLDRAISAGDADLDNAAVIRQLRRERQS